MLRWKKLVSRLRSRRDRRPSRPEHLAPFLPRIYRLEDRRVLDVSAAFTSATGQLDLLLTNSAETATVTVVTGNLTIKDSQNNQVSISVDGGASATPVNASAVDSIRVAGDSAGGQAVQFDSPLALPKGLVIEGSIERANLNAELNRIDQGPIQIDAVQTNLGGDILTAGQDIAFGGSVRLTDDVRLSGVDIVFAKSLDDDGVANTSSTLLVEASGLTRFGGATGSLSPLTRIETDAAGRTEIHGNVSANGNTILFVDPVTLTNDSSITDSGSTGVVFGSTVDSLTDGQFGLTVSAPNGQVKFNGSLGAGTAGDQRLGSLKISSAPVGVVFGELGPVTQVKVAGPVDIGMGANAIGGAGIVLSGGPLGMAITADGGFRLNGPTFLESDVRISTAGGDIRFASDATIDSQLNLTSALTLDAGTGAIFFNADVGSVLPLRGLTIARADAGVTFGGADAKTPGGAGPVNRVHSVDAIFIGTVTNVIAGGIVFNAGSAQFLNITTTNDLVSLHGPVTLRSGLSVNTGPGIGDIRFQSGSSNSESGETNDLFLSAGSGSISFSDDLGATVPLESLVIERADGGVTFGTADSAGTGNGPVIQFVAQGVIDIGAGTNEIAGTGILLNGGSSGLQTITSLSGDIRFNGPVLLDTSVRINAGGNVKFTNDAPVDSRVGEINSLTISVAAGSVSFNEDLGRSTSLGSLTVLQASDGVIFGGATNEIPGAGGLGPVEIIQLDGAMDLGVGNNVVDGVGIVLGGSAIAPLRIRTTDDSVRMNGVVTLQTDVLIATGATGANILFSNAASIDSGPIRHSSLTLDAGSGQIEFNEDLGSVRPLGSLTVTRADGGVIFGRADVESANGTGPVNAIETDQPIDIGTGANVIGGTQIVFNGGDNSVVISTTNDNVRLNGQILLHSDFTIDTGDGPGDVIFTSAASIDSADSVIILGSKPRNVFLDAGDGSVFFNADLGVVNPLATLIVDRAAGGVVFGGADVATVGGAGPVTQVLVDGLIDLGSGSTPDDILGSIIFNGGNGKLEIATVGSDIRVNGPTVLQGDVFLNTGTGKAKIEFTEHASIDSQIGEFRSLEVFVDQGDVRFAAAIGATIRLGDLILHSAHDVNFEAAVTAERIVQESSSGRTTFQSNVRTTDTLSPGIDLFGRDFTFDGGVLATGNGRVLIQHTGLLDINPDADFRIDGSFTESGGGTVQLGADLATSADTIEFNSSVNITDGVSGPSLLSTVAGGQAAGATIRFGATVDGQAAGAQRLLINAGTSGDIIFEDAVGSSVPLGVITVIQARNIVFGSLTAERILQLDGQGTTSFGEVTLNHATLAAIELKTRNVQFRDAVTTTGQGSVKLDVSATLDIADAANMSLEGSFQQLGAATVRASANISTSGDDISFAGPVLLRDVVRLDTGDGSGSIRFQNSLNSSAGLLQDLTVNVGSGDVTFLGAVGRTDPLDRLQIETVRDVIFAGEVHIGALHQLDGTGTTMVDGALTTSGLDGVDITTKSITFNATVVTRGGAVDGPLKLTATEDIQLNGVVLTGTAEMTIFAHNDVFLGPTAFIQSVSGAISIGADSDAFAGGEVAMQDGAIVDSGSAQLTVTARDDIVVGRLVSQAQVTLITVEGAILDGGDSTGSDVVAPIARFEAAFGIGTDATGTGQDAIASNPLETEVPLVAALNSTSGGIHLTNLAVGDLTIGSVEGLVGLINLGSGSIEITNRGQLNVNQAILNQGGGDTRLRAEFPADLIINAPIQNTGGNGSILLFSGGDLVIHNSLPEPPDNQEYPEGPEQYFEIMVSGGGAVRGEARKEVLFDDGEFNYVIVHTATGQITNPMPQLKVVIVDQGGSDVDEQGIGIVQVIIGDNLHLETNFHIQIDWGDGEIENYPIPGTIHPLREPGNTDPRFVSGAIVETTQAGAGEDPPAELRMPGIYSISHKYFQHPNSDNPAEPIPIRVELRYDPRAAGEIGIDGNRPGEVSAVFNGIRFVDQVAMEMFAFEEDRFTVPGTGNFTFIKVVESVIVPVELRTITVEPPVQTAVSVTATTGERGEFRARSVELQRPEEYRFYLTVVDDVVETESDDRIELDIELLSDPLSLFRTRRFPNGHYRVYLEEVRTRRIRLILDVHVFNGKVVPPNYREGSGEKEPDTDQVPEASAPATVRPPANQNGSLEKSSQPRIVSVTAAKESATVSAASFVTAERDGHGEGHGSDGHEWPDTVRNLLAGESRSMTSAARLWRRLNQLPN